MPLSRYHIVATSDLHGELPDISNCDLLLIAGDICPDGSIEEQAKWLDTTFRKWLEFVPAKEIVAVAGNHDFIFEKKPRLIPQKLRWHYLQDQFIHLYEFKIYGTPWQLPFWGAFNSTENELKEKYALMPKDIDILISHGPPFGIRDEVIPYSESDNRELDLIHTGSITLRNQAFEIKPQLMVFGHIHDAFGIVHHASTMFANVSLLNDEMEIAHHPLSFEYEITKGFKI